MPVFNKNVEGESRVRTEGTGTGKWAQLSDQVEVKEGVATQLAVETTPEVDAYAELEAALLRWVNTMDSSMDIRANSRCRGAFAPYTPATPHTPQTSLASYSPQTQHTAHTSQAHRPLLSAAPTEEQATPRKICPFSSRGSPMIEREADTGIDHRSIRMHSPYRAYTHVRAGRMVTTSPPAVITARERAPSAPAPRRFGSLLELLEPPSSRRLPGQRGMAGRRGGEGGDVLTESPLTRTYAVQA